MSKKKSADEDIRIYVPGRNSSDIVISEDKAESEEVRIYTGSTSSKPPLQ